MVRPDRLQFAMDSYITSHMPDVLQNGPVSYTQLQEFLASKSLASFIQLPTVNDQTDSTKLAMLSRSVADVLRSAATVSGMS